MVNRLKTWTVLNGNTSRPPFLKGSQSSARRRAATPPQCESLEKDIRLGILILGEASNRAPHHQTNTRTKFVRDRGEKSSRLMGDQDSANTCRYLRGTSQFGLLESMGMKRAGEAPQ